MASRVWRHYDTILLATVLLLLAYGIAMLYSATGGRTAQREFPADPLFRQIIYAAVGLALSWVAAAIDYRVWRPLGSWLYGLAIVSLVAVLFLGVSIHGAQRWIQAPGIQLQPSEFAKLLVILGLASFLARRVEAYGEPDEDYEDDEATYLPFRDLLISLAIALAPAVLVYRQPDLGTAIIIMVTWLGMVIAARARWEHLGLLALMAIVLAPFFLLSTHGYIRERIDIYLDPTKDPFGAGYNVIQARISVGSGGLFGRGFSLGEQSQYDFLRVKYADFIFSVISEELGFLGALLLLALFTALVLRAFRVAELARDAYGRLLAIGIATNLLFQAFANIGMNITLLPAVGVPLPFISAGGSSLITIMVAIGMLQSALMRHKPLEF